MAISQSQEKERNELNKQIENKLEKPELPEKLQKREM
jgi:hypothetical protein